MNAAQALAGRVSDRAYLALQFRRAFNRWPSLHNPQSFNERLLDYKLTSRGDERLTMMADKIAAKGLVASVVGPQYVIPTIWYGDELPPREKRAWPKPYVIKSAHGSGQCIFVREGETEDWDRIEAAVQEWLSGSYAIGRDLREWHYQDIPRRGPL